MKNKQLLCVLFSLLVACTGQRHQQQVSSESIIEEAVRKGEVLKGRLFPLIRLCSGMPIVCVYRVTRR